MRAIFDHYTHEADDILTFWFTPLQPVDATAGQFIELTLKHTPADDRGEKRWFTLSSTPHDPRGISITTRYAGDACSSSFKKALRILQRGDAVTITQPMGDFVLPKNTHTPLIFVAGGIGVTPFHSMFTWLTEQHEQRAIQFLYSVQNEDEIIFQDTFEKAGIHATIFVENPDEAWGGERGRLTPDQIIALTQPTPDSLIYLSGPEAMIETLSQGLHHSGIPKKQLVTDFFPGYDHI